MVQEFQSFRSVQWDCILGEAGLELRVQIRSELERPQSGGVTITLTQFDQKHYRELIRARGETIRRVVGELKPVLQLCTALDAGCGIGFFTEILRECGLSAGGFDGREENVVEARRRFPGIPFERGDIEDVATTAMGKFDLVLCFGLLYHLENPMLAIRHLRALTGQGLLLESMCIPGAQAEIMLREEPRAADQSLSDIALYPSEDCLVKMLYRAGYSSVNRVASLPDHDDFRETAEHTRRRTVLFASVEPIRLAGLEQIAEPRQNGDPWAKNGSRGLARTLSQRVWNFIHKPLRAKYIALALRARRRFPGMPIPLRLAFGAWWLAEKSALDEKLIHNRDSFESGEQKFVERVLRPGVTVLDVGAHHGLYTLLASKRVGRKGRVIAFEPSPRERRRLQRHLRLNGRWNVTVVPCALGEETGEAELFVVEESEDWCNSLRPPVVPQRTSKIVVDVRRADEALAALGVRAVDFIKVDVEGAELSFFRGASQILHGHSRPAMLVEVQDFRTRAWGYEGRDLVEFVRRLSYTWFGVTSEGRLEAMATTLASYDANLVALPEERVDEFLRLLAD